MTLEPKVSVIIPTYNYAHFIGETLVSIESQRYQNWECIVVDNGSTDNTKETVALWEQKDSRFKYLYISHTTTSGCRNAGVAKSIGDFIQFVDADDQIAPGKIENQIALFEKNPDASIVYSNARYYDHGIPDVLRFSHDPTQNKPWMEEYSGRTWDLLAKMFDRNIFVISSPLLKRCVLEDTGGFFEGLNWVEDWDFYFRCFALNYRLVYDPAPDSLSLIRVHPKSLSRNKAMMMEQSLIARTHVKTTLSKLTDYKNGNQLIGENNRYVKFLHRMLVNEYAQNDAFKSRSHLIQFAWLDNDYKLIIKALQSCLTGKTITFPDETNESKPK